MDGLDWIESRLQRYVAEGRSTMTQGKKEGNQELLGGGVFCVVRRLGAPRQEKNEGLQRLDKCKCMWNGLDRTQQQTSVVIVYQRSHVGSEHRCR